MGKVGTMSMIGITYVCDPQANRHSASVANCNLLHKTVSHYAPDVPMWPYNVHAAVDEELRYANKITAIGCADIRQGYLLFLDSDVILCRTPEWPDLQGIAIAGVHMDYPSEPTYDGFAIPVWKDCGQSYPSKRVKCTMYGGSTTPVINSGVLFVRWDVCGPLARVWETFFHGVKDKPYMTHHRSYAEQMTLMPAIAALGLDYQLLPVHWNWNGTIFPSDRCHMIEPHQEVTFLHYHRQDVLSTDPVAQRVLRDIGEVV